MYASTKNRLWNFIIVHKINYPMFSVYKTNYHVAEFDGLCNMIKLSTIDVHTISVSDWIFDDILICHDFWCISWAFQIGRNITNVVNTSYLFVDVFDIVMTNHLDFKCRYYSYSTSIFCIGEGIWTLNYNYLLLQSFNMFIKAYLK